MCVVRGARGNSYGGGEGKIAWVRVGLPGEVAQNSIEECTDKRQERKEPYERVHPGYIFPPMPNLAQRKKSEKRKA